jgi:hopanoid biosynthesis associated RND transporter like protein HpnN
VPEVGQILTLASFVPDDQERKLTLIRDADMLLDPTLNPILQRPAPSDADTVATMKTTAAQLHSAAAADRTKAGVAADALARALDGLSSASRQHRAIAEEALVPGLRTMLDQLRAALTAEPVTLKSLPQDLTRSWVAPDGTARLQVFPHGSIRSNDDLTRFSDAVLRVAPEATGAPISIQNYGKTILRAFIQAGVASTLAITAILWLVLRRLRDTVLTLIPLLLTGLLTLATCSIIGLQLNFANVIALPLLLGVGVAFDIYFIAAWRDGTRELLSTSLTRAVIFSALTTASGFGTLWMSSHPGTASMGQLLMISLAWTLATTLFFLPALLDTVRESPNGDAATRTNRRT